MLNLLSSFSVSALARRQLVDYLLEHGFEPIPHLGEDGNDHHGNQARNQAVLDGGSAVFVVPELLKLSFHDFPLEQKLPPDPVAGRPSGHFSAACASGAGKQNYQFFQFALIHIL